MTTIVDTFNRADSTTTLGTTSDGNATWTAQIATWGISSNQAYTPTIVGGTGLATVPGQADGTVQVTVAANTTNGVGLAFRCSDASNYWIVIRQATSSFGGLWKLVGGSLTHVATFNPAVGDVVSVDFSGSSITPKVNGSAVSGAPFTDSFNQTATLCGLYTEHNANRLDDFSFTPPGVAPPARRPRITVGRSLFASSGLR